MSFQIFWEEMREKRTRKLEASDWTQMPDCPLSNSKKAEWATYRQALRDIPSKWSSDVDEEEVNPFDGTVEDIWPTKPS